MKILLSVDARDDLRSAHDYIHENGDPVVANEFMGRVYAALQLLARFPNLGHQGTVPGTFEMVVPRLPFVIVYRVDLGNSDELIALRVFHTAHKIAKREQSPALEPVRIVCIGMSAGVSPVSAKKVLTTTRELLSKSGAWGQHAFAYDDSDERILWDDRRACCWCLEGGIKVSARRSAATRRHYNEALSLVKDEIVILGFFGSVQGWNDRRDTTQELVLTVIDRAIAKA